MTIYRFGEFAVDVAERRLLDGGAPVELSARYFDALVLLLAEAGRLVTKDRFMAEVWGGIPVTDEALTQCIRTLRRALDDDAAAPKYIETVPRHGYRFIAPVEASGEAARSSTPRRFPALSEEPRRKVNAAFISANPNPCYQVVRDAHIPAVGGIVRSTCFTPDLIVFLQCIAQSP